MTQKPCKHMANWLVASDIDGTLNTKARKLPERNLEAIRHFTQDLGGCFTLASGRSVPSMKKHYLRLPIAGTPAVVLNGAGIYDFANEKMLQFNQISSEGMALVKETYQCNPQLEVQICTENKIYMVHSRVFGPVMLRADHLPHVSCKSFDEVPDSGWGKVIFFGIPPLIRKIKAQCEKIVDPPVNCMSSSVVTYELLGKGIHKGTAVLQLADILRIEYSHTAAIGDYFNDYDMLKTVAVSAVCAQAPPEMHVIADFISCHCNKGAVANFLEYLEQKHTNGTTPAHDYC